MHKVRGCIFSTFLLFALLFYGNIATADGKLDPSAYNEGDTSLGENVIVGMVEKTGEKFLTGHNGLGKLRFSVNLASEFEVSVKIDCRSGATDIFLASEESQIKTEFGCYGSGGVNMYLQGGGKVDSSAWIPESKNDVKLSVKDNVVRLYINDVFSQKFTLTDGSLAYTKLIINGLTERNALYEVAVSGSALVLQPFQEWEQGWTDSFKASAYPEGDTTLGESVIVGMVEKTEEKFLSGHSGIGKLRFAINLSSEFEVSMKIDCRSGATDLFLVSEESQIKTEFGCYGSGGVNMYLQGGDKVDSSAWIPEGKNDVKLSVNGNLVKLYINEVFSQKVTLKDANVTYSKLIINGLTGQNALYQVAIKGSGLVPQPFQEWDQGWTDLLNVSTYAEGDTSLGENVIVGMVEKTGEKYLAGHSSPGKIQFPVNLSSRFAVSVKIDCRNGATDLFLVSEESQIKTEFGCYGSGGVNMYLQGGDKVDSSAWIPEGKNDVKVSVNGNLVKLYINDVFSQKVTLKDANLTYSKLIINGLTDQNALYKVSINTSGEGGSTTTGEIPSPVKPCGCPSLGKGHATDATGKTVTTETTHEAGISVNNQPPVIQVKQKLSDTVDVMGDIIVDPVDVGQPVDIFVYAAATFPGLSAVSYYMLGPGLTILPWNQQPASLVAFSNGTLGVVQTVQMYSGTFFYPGTLKVYFGYRLPNGIVVTSNTPIDIMIEQ